MLDYKTIVVISFSSLPPLKAEATHGCFCFFLFHGHRHRYGRNILSSAITTAVFTQGMNHIEQKRCKKGGMSLKCAVHPNCVESQAGYDKSRTFRIVPARSFSTNGFIKKSRIPETAAFSSVINSL